MQNKQSNYHLPDINQRNNQNVNRSKSTNNLVSVQELEKKYVEKTLNKVNNAEHEIGELKIKEKDLDENVKFLQKAYQDEKPKNDQAKLNLIKSKLDMYQSKLAEVQTQLSILENTNEQIELQKKLDESIIIMEQKNNQILDELETKHSKEIRDIEETLVNEQLSKEQEYNERFEGKIYESKEAEEVALKLEHAKQQEVWEDATILDRKLQLIKQRDVKNSVQKNKKLIEEKLKKIKASHKKTLEKEHANRQRILSMMKADMKKESINFIKSQKVSNDSKEKLINIRFKELYRHKASQTALGVSDSPINPVDKKPMAASVINKDSHLQDMNYHQQRERKIKSLQIDEMNEHQKQFKVTNTNTKKIMSKLNNQPNPTSQISSNFEERQANHNKIREAKTKMIEQEENLTFKPDIVTTSLPNYLSPEKRYKFDLFKKEQRINDSINDSPKTVKPKINENSRKMAEEYSKSGRFEHRLQDNGMLSEKLQNKKYKEQKQLKDINEEEEIREFKISNSQTNKILGKMQENNHYLSKPFQERQQLQANHVKAKNEDMQQKIQSQSDTNLDSTGQPSKVGKPLLESKKGNQKILDKMKSEDHQLSQSFLKRQMGHVSQLKAKKDEMAQIVYKDVNFKPKINDQPLNDQKPPQKNYDTRNVDQLNNQNDKKKQNMDQLIKTNEKKTQLMKSKANIIYKAKESSKINLKEDEDSDS